MTDHRETLELAAWLSNFARLQRDYGKLDNFELMQIREAARRLRALVYEKAPTLASYE